MLILRRLVAVLLALALLLLLLPALIAFRVDATLPQADFYVEELRKADIYAFADEEVLPAAVHEAMKDWEQPLGMQLQEADVVEAVRRVIPRDWLQAQVESSITQVVPYLVGAEDTFRITVSLQERAEEALDERAAAAVGVVKELLLEADLQSLIIDGVIAPEVERGLGSSLDLSFGLPGFPAFSVTVTSDEIVQVVKEVATEEWLDAQVDRIIDAAMPYVLGQQEEFQVTISLEDRKEAILDGVAGLVAIKIGGVPGGFVGAVFGLIPAQVAESIGVPLPDTIIFTEADLRRAMSPDSLELLDEARSVIREGWTYTEANLRRDLAGNPDNLDTLDEVRENVDRARGLRWLLLLVLGLLLAGIGLLGGRNWSERAGWAAGALAVAALVAYVAARPVYDSQAEPRLRDALTDARDDRDGTELLLVDKAIYEVERVAGEFASAVAGRAATLLIVALLILAGSLAWSRVAPLLRRGSAAT